MNDDYSTFNTLFSGDGKIDEKLLKRFNKKQLLKIIRDLIDYVPNKTEKLPLVTELEKKLSGYIVTQNELQSKLIVAEKSKNVLLEQINTLKKEISLLKPMQQALNNLTAERSKWLKEQRRLVNKT